MQHLRFLAFLLATASLVHAQQKDADGKSRMYFFPDQEKKLDEPKLAEPEKKPAKSTGKIASPDERIAAFFAALEKEDRGSLRRPREGQHGWRAKGRRRLTRSSAPSRLLDGYGSIAGYEVVEEKTVGTHLMRRTCLSLNSDLPLRWRFYFYESDGQWKLIDLRVDDALVELFEDAPRPKK